MSAQEALRTVVQADRAYESRVAAAAQGHPDLGMRAGPVSFALGASISAEYNDNVRLAEGRQQHDIIISPGIRFGAHWPISRTSRLSLGVGLAYRKHLEFPENDHLQLAPGSQLALDVPIRDVIISLYNSVSYSQDVLDLTEVTGRARYPQLNNVAGMRVSWLPERWLIQGGYAFARYWVFDDELIGPYRGGDQNRGSHQVFARVGRFIVVRTRAGLEGSASLTEYDSGRRNSFQSYSFGPFAEWHISDRIRLDARGGYVIYTFDAPDPFPDPDDVDGWYGALELSHRLTTRLSYNAGFAHQLQSGIQSDLTQSSTFRIGGAWSFMTPASLGFSFNYGESERKGAGLTERYSWYGPSLNLSYAFTRKLRPSLSYTYQKRESDTAARTYENNRIAISLSYSF